MRDRLARGGRLFVPLAHVTWHLEFGGAFKWREGIIIPVTNSSSFRVDKPVKGDLTDKEITGLLATLAPSTTPVYNVKSRESLAEALDKPDESENRSDQIPPLFFLEGRGTLDIP